VDFSRVGEDPQFRTVDGVQGGELVGERLSGGCTRGDDDVLAGVGDVGSLHLMTIRFLDAECRVGVDNVRMHPLGPWLVDGFSGRDGVDVAQLLWVGSPAQQGDQRIW